MHWHCTDAYPIHDHVSCLRANKGDPEKIKWIKKFLLPFGSIIKVDFCVTKYKQPVTRYRRHLKTCYQSILQCIDTYQPNTKSCYYGRQSRCDSSPPNSVLLPASTFAHFRPTRKQVKPGSMCRWHIGNAGKRSRTSLNTRWDRTTPGETSRQTIYDAGWKDKE